MLKTLAQPNAAVLLSCWLTFFILSLEPFSTRPGPLDIFPPHITLHVVELNLLIPYWSLLCRPFTATLSTFPISPSLPPLRTNNSRGLFSMYMKRGGGKKWKHSKSRSIHVVIVWDGSCQRWQFETLDPQKWILGQGQVTARSNSFFWNV